MSPVGGVGINLAIQDAVATANLLAAPLREGRITEWWLAQVQQRREFPTRVTQRIQVLAHSALQRVFVNPVPAKAPWQLKVAASLPGVQHVLARVIGMGVRPEHINGARKPSRFCIKNIAVGVGVAMGMVAFAVVMIRKQRRRATA
jgi:FAD binding domain-containing protein